MPWVKPGDCDRPDAQWFGQEPAKVKRLMLRQDQIRRRNAALADRPLHLQSGYYFVHAPGGRSLHLVRSLRDWIVAAAAPFRLDCGESGGAARSDAKRW